MEKVTTQSRPSICELGLNGCKTFNISITKVRNAEEYTCYSHTAENPSVVDIVPPFVKDGITLTQKEIDSINDNCEPTTFGKLVSAIVRTKYSADDVEAIILNQGDGEEEHEKEYDELLLWRKFSKETAKNFVNESA